MTMTDFDPTDKTHQVDPKSPPDKADKWTTPLEHDQWVLTHNALRAELDAMKGALAAIADRKEDALPEWAVASLKTWWDGHVAHSADHCKSEEEVRKPMLCERFKWPENLTEEHGALEKQRDKVAKVVEEIPDKATVADLQQAWSEYESKFLPHLKREEETALPLMRAYFTEAEISPVDRKVLEDAPANAMGAMIHTMGEDRFRGEFMKEKGIPFFVWHVAFKGRLASYRTDMVAHIEALESGTAPKVAKKSGRFW